MFKKYFLRFFILQFLDIDGTIEVIKLFFMNYFLFIFRNILRNDEKYLICKVNSGLTGWIWWIFKYLPVRLITRIFTSFLLEGHKVNPGSFIFITGISKVMSALLSHILYVLLRLEKKLNTRIIFKFSCLYILLCCFIM